VARDAIARHFNAAVMWANQGYPNELIGINQLIAETQQMQYAPPYMIENFRQTRRQQLIMSYQQLANSYNVWPEIQYESRVMINLFQQQQQQQNTLSPELSQEVINSCVDMLSFMIAEVQGQNTSTITAEAKDAVRNMFILQAQNMSPQQIQQLNLIPQMWQQVQSMWPNISEAEKQQARNIWAAQLGISSGQPDYNPTQGNAPIGQGTNNKNSMSVATSVKGDKNVTGANNVIGDSNTIINFHITDEKMLKSVLELFGKRQ
jgi:hypothetical protein